MDIRSATPNNPIFLSSITRQFNHLLLGLLLGLGCFTASSLPSLSQTSAAVPSEDFSEVAPSLLTQQSPRSLEDGVYLYGQAPEPEQIGSAYMVFEVNQNEVIGAFYMMNSSFDCFRGEFQADRLSLNVVDSYERTIHPYSIALDTDSSVAQLDGEAIAPIGLEGFHRIEQLNELDRRILSVCQSDLR